LQRKVVRGRTAAEVRDKLTVLRAGIVKGVRPTRSMTLAQYLGVAETTDADGTVQPARGWLRRQQDRVRGSTFRHREQCVRLYLAPHLGRITLERLAPSDVERMTSQLIASGRSPRTASHARVVLRSALQDAVRDGVIERDVASLARPPKVGRRELDYLTPAQIRKLLDACVDRTGPDGKPIKAPALGNLFTLAATLGLRQGELLGLTWVAVELEERRLAVRQAMARTRDGGYALAQPKTAGSRRTVPLPSDAVEALERQRAIQDERKATRGRQWQDRDDLVFTDVVGRPLRGDSVNAALRRLLKAEGLPVVPFHGLRHSAATALLSAGVSLKVVSEILGHSTIVLTANTYGHVIPEQRSEAAAAMDRVLGR